MTLSVHGVMRGLAFLGAFFVGSCLVEFSLAPAPSTWAGPSGGATMDRGQGDAERGRNVFNGKGICFYCHGEDGRIDRLPRLAPQTIEIINNLHPKPTDLRNPGRLTLKTDDERFNLIRKGHSSTGMFPDTLLKDEEITDLLAYLATLRSQAPPQDKPRQR